MRSYFRRLYLQVIALFLLSILLVQTAVAETAQDTVSLIERILNDPMLPRSVKGARLVLKDKHSKREGDYLTGDSIDYDITNIGLNSSVNKAHIYPRATNTFDISIFFANDDQIEAIMEPKWEKLELGWDAFVSRYWPGLERLDDWRREISRYRPGRGLFTIRYVLKDKDAQVFSVDVDIRLADGKIGGVSTLDKRPLLTSNPVTLAPSQDTLLAAARKAWMDSRAKTSLHNLRFLDKNRFIFLAPTGGISIHYSSNLLAETDDSKTVVINADYDEIAGKTQITSVISQEELNKLNQRPYTQVEDTQPVWSANGEQLYFVTTRNIKGYPWWRRGTMEYSIALWRGSLQNNGLMVIDPIKVQTGNYGLYDTPSPSPSGRYLAGSFGGNQKQLFVLDLQAGLFFLPQRDPKWRAALVKKWHLPPNQLTGDLPWDIKGVAWPSDENTLLIAMPFDWPDYDLFLAGHTPHKPPQLWDLKPLDVDRGDAILPCLAKDGKVIAYGHSVPQTTEQVKEDKPKKWQLVVTDFDKTTAKISDRRTLSLGSEPSSISWDSQGDRWLVVTVEKMIWVKESKGALQASRVNDLKWGEIALHPTSAAISPKDGRIAIAAELSQPQVDKKTEAIVVSTIFLWDGKSQEAQPLFNTSQNGLPRYEFPATKSPWARINGDVKKFGLSGMADPKFFVAEQPVLGAEDKTEGQQAP